MKRHVFLFYLHFRHSHKYSPASVPILSPSISLCDKVCCVIKVPQTSSAVLLHFKRQTFSNSCYDTAAHTLNAIPMIWLQRTSYSAKLQFQYKQLDIISYSVLQIKGISHQSYHVPILLLVNTMTITLL